MTPHLTEAQFGDLLAAAPANPIAEVHLLACPQCSDELASMRESLSLFRQASSAHADNELRRLPPMTLPARSTSIPALQPTFFLAAAALFLAAFIPMQTLRQHNLQPAVGIATSSVNNSQSQTQSDDALLEDVDRDASASVPAPMQALADPTDSTSLNSPAQTSTQRTN